MRTLLIDGDAVAYRGGYSAEPKGYVRKTVLRWQEELGAARSIVAFSCPREQCFRRAISPTYKTRPSNKPPGYSSAAEGLFECFTTRCIHGLEADDVLGVLATHPAVEGERVVVAQDKDMRTIPGLHWNPWAEPRAGVVEVCERDADFNHLRQTLVGDSGDGYPGCPGVGPKSVPKILWGDPGQWWGQVVCAFKGKGLTEADALVQARLARILRASDVDIPPGRSGTVVVRPWLPPPPPGSRDLARSA